MENIGRIFLVFLNVVTPVFILVVIGYFVGPRLKIDARSLSKTAYFVFIPAFVFNIISGLGRLAPERSSQGSALPSSSIAAGREGTLRKSI